MTTVIDGNQIADDIHDFQQDTSHEAPLRPSLILAFLWEEGSEEIRDHIQNALKQKKPYGAILEQIGKHEDTNHAIERARELLHTHRTNALNALCPVTNMELKSLLMRLVRKIVIDV